ncbi:hypothetical protein [Prosthecochloris sp. SCSIO W1103]|uniref:hypothetical protein n=1 Tax=Prosthecochloris sp. SCSIO W1103 TaxID=2992244 RepID=UPI00223DC270|nr:hypothetical protein [Prosthecochloris sp. SCSIO W1103]UZJ36456.1 hypothetical protein OO005_06710 [Prosthecochloris sp. SCSIO W1103]
MIVLDTKASLCQIDSLLEFENRHYGADFRVNQSEISHWHKHQTFFCSAVLSDNGLPRSVCSILVTTSDSIDLLLEGRITEAELQPWYPSVATFPVFYYASLILGEPTDAKPAFSTLIFDLRYSSINEWGQFPQSAFAIACSSAGEKYLARECFERIPQLYRSRYPFYYLSEDQAQGGLFGRIFAIAAEQITPNTEQDGGLNAPPRMSHL